MTFSDLLPRKPLLFPVPESSWDICLFWPWLAFGPLSHFTHEVLQFETMWVNDDVGEMSIFTGRLFTLGLTA